jgi:hypothetical protein
MSILDRLKDRIKNPALAEIVKEQNLKDLLIRREFRIPEGYLQREFLDLALDEEIQEIVIILSDGFGSIKGRVKKRFLPAIPFSITFSVHGIEFSSARKQVLLKLEQVAPIDIGWVTKKFVDKIDFLSCSGDLVACDLTKVPRLARLFAYRVKGINPWDFVTLKELTVAEGEIVGRVGVVI